MYTTSMATGNYIWKIFSKLQIFFFFCQKKSRSVETLTPVPCHGENRLKKKQLTINLDSTLLSKD